MNFKVLESEIQAEPFFPSSNLISGLKKANKIKGKTVRIKGGYYYLGSKTYRCNNKNMSVGFVFIPNIGDSKLVKMLGIKCLCRENDMLVVLMPSLKIEDISFKNIIHSHNIVQESMADLLSDNSFELPIDDILKPLFKNGIKVHRQELEKAQIIAYQKYGFKCYDRLILRAGRKVILNEHEIQIGDKPYKLLKRLAIQLKSKYGTASYEGGWVSRYDLADERIVSDAESYHPYSDLRRLLQPALINRNGKDFIESYNKQYRISTYPEWVEVE